MGLTILIVVLAVATHFLNGRFVDGMKYDKNAKLAKYKYYDDTYVYKYAKSWFLS